MTNHMRTVRHLGAMVLACVAASAIHAQSADYPSKPITIVVPYPPGGVSDQLARGIGQKLTESMKVPVVVENRPGGGAQIAASFVKQAPADGYTVMVGDIGALAMNSSLYAKLSYDVPRDFTPLARLVIAEGLLVVPANSPFNTMTDLVNEARRRTEGVTIASQSPGSGGHLFAELLRNQTKGHFVHVPYRGSAPALTELMGGQVQVLFDPIVSSGPLVKEGKLKALAISGDRRSSQFPTVPTLQELGYGNLNLNAWFGMAVKAGTPPAVVARLSDEVGKAMTSPDLAKRFTDQGLDISLQGPEAFKTFVQAETLRLGKIIKDAGIKLD